MSKIIKFVRMQEAPMILDSRLKEELAQSEVNDTAEKMVLAKDEVAELLANAEERAEQCIEEAEEQAALIKQQAHDEGYQQGYEGGFTQGQQASRQEMEQLVQQTIAKTQQVLTVASGEAQEMILTAEQQIIEIALAVARKIMAYEISENPMVVLPLVKAALQKVSDQEEVVIRVSIDDFNAVTMAKSDLQIMVGREHALKIMADQTIESGSCIIDTSYGTVDAKIDTQLDIIRKTLQEVIK